MVIRNIHRFCRILLTCPAQVHFRLLTCSITSVTFVFSLTQMFAFLSPYVIFNIPLSIFVCVVASLFFAWLVSVHASAPYVIAGSTHELQTCFFNHVPLVPLIMSRFLTNFFPSGRDSSLNLLVLVYVTGAVSLSQVGVAFNVLDLSVFDIIYWCVVFHLRKVHIQTLIFTFIS